MESLPDLNCNHLLLRFKVCKFEKFLHKLYLWRVIEDRFRVWWFLVNILSTGSLISTPQKNSPRTSIWISMEDILSVILIYFRLSEKVYDTKLQILGNSRLPNFFSLRKNLNLFSQRKDLYWSNKFCDYYVAVYIVQFSWEIWCLMLGPKTKLFSNL